MSLLIEIEEFCTVYEIGFSTMPLYMTNEINGFLSTLWQGTTGKLNWELTNTSFLKVNFPNEIDNDVISKIISNLEFQLLNEDNAYLYFSGSEQMLQINTRDFFLNLFNFMDEFSFLDFIYFFSTDSFKNDDKKINAVELRVFEYMCGNI